MTVPSGLGRLRRAAPPACADRTRRPSRPRRALPAPARRRASACTSRTPSSSLSSSCAAAPRAPARGRRAPAGAASRAARSHARTDLSWSRASRLRKLSNSAFSRCSASRYSSRWRVTSCQLVDLDRLDHLGSHDPGNLLVPPASFNWSAFADIAVRLVHYESWPLRPRPRSRRPRSPRRPVRSRHRPTNGADDAAVACEYIASAQLQRGLLQRVGLRLDLGDVTRLEHARSSMIRPSIVEAIATRRACRDAPSATSRSGRRATPPCCGRRRAHAACVPRRRAPRPP